MSGLNFVSLSSESQAVKSPKTKYSISLVPECGKSRCLTIWVIQVVCGMALGAEFIPMVTFPAMRNGPRGYAFAAH